MSNLQKRYDSDYELYLGAISADPVATVLRFHLLSEYYLERAIRIALPRGDKIVDSGNFSYAQKLCVIEATGAFSDTLVSCLKNLNKLRNKCSHQLNHAISQADLETIGSPLGKTWTAIKSDHPEEIKRMNFLFGTISAGLALAIEDAEKKFHGS